MGRHLFPAIILSGLVWSPVIHAAEGTAQGSPATNPPGDFPVPLKPRSDDRPNIGKQKPFKKKPEPALKLPKIEAPLEKSPTLPAGLFITVAKIRFNGNTVFSDEELNKLVEVYIDRKLSSLDLEELRVAVTNYYIDHGYINSGTLIPDQDLDDNTLILKIIEGQLTQIRVQNEGMLSNKYIINRIKLGENEVLNIAALQEKLYLLQQNPRIKQINASLGPGTALGESILDIRVIEDKGYRATFQLDNHSPPSIGEARGSIDFTHFNFSGGGDTINFNARQTEGFKERGLYYLYPLTANDTMFRFEYVTSTAKIVDPPGIDFITSEAYTGKVGVYVPLIKTANEEFNFEILMDRRQSFSQFNHCGATKHKCNISALRLTQSWISRRFNEVFFFRHTFSLGTKAFNATVADHSKKDGNPENDPLESDDPYPADGQFIKWLGQYQWSKRFNKYRIQTLFRGDIQLSNDPLFAMEQFSIGGANTVRGYRENTYVRDNGLIASFELRFPIYRSSSTKQRLETIVFTDYGNAWNYDDHNFRSQYLFSIGLGLKYNLSDLFAADIYWGVPLNGAQHNVEGGKTTLQDHGIHVSFDVKLL